MTELLISLFGVGATVMLGIKWLNFKKRIRNGNHYVDFCRKHGHMKMGSDQFWIKNGKQFRQCQRCNKFYKVKWDLKQ